MKRKIPSTVALSVFEAAARHESFARAAAELHRMRPVKSRRQRSWVHLTTVSPSSNVNGYEKFSCPSRVRGPALDGSLNVAQDCIYSLRPTQHGKCRGEVDPIIKTDLTVV